MPPSTSNPPPTGISMSILKNSLNVSVRQQPTGTISTSAANQKSVGFQNRTRIYLIPNLTSYSQDDYDACFSTVGDEKRNTSDLVKTINTMRTSSRAEKNRDDFCARGLEHMSSTSAALQRKDNRNRSVHSVLDEQDDQLDGGYVDSDRLAVASSVLSSTATDLAATRAASDAAVARHLNPSSLVTKVSTIDLGIGKDTVAAALTSSSTTSMHRTLLENTLSKVLSSPELTTITSNMTITAAHHRGRSSSVGSQGSLADLGQN